MVKQVPMMGSFYHKVYKKGVEAAKKGIRIAEQVGRIGDVARKIGEIAEDIKPGSKVGEIANKVADVGDKAKHAAEVGKKIGMKLESVFPKAPRMNRRGVPMVKGVPMMGVDSGIPLYYNPTPAQPIPSGTVPSSNPFSAPITPFNNPTQVLPPAYPDPPPYSTQPPPAYVDDAAKVFDQVENQFRKQGLPTAVTETYKNIVISYLALGLQWWLEAQRDPADDEFYQNTDWARKIFKYLDYIAPGWGYR
jgi:hypothetical protein